MGNMDIDVRVQRVKSSRASTWAKTLKIVYYLYFKSLTVIYNFLWFKSCARKTIFRKAPPIYIFVDSNLTERRPTSSVLC